MKKILLILLVIVLAICGYFYFAKKSPESSLMSPSTTSSTTTPTALSFDQIKNVEVPASWQDGDFVQLKNGNYDGRLEESKGEPTGIPNTYVSTELLLATTTYATTDFDGDGNEDILVTIASNSGGTGWFNDLLAFRNENGKPVYAGKVSLGDRIKVNQISADKNIVTTDIITQGPGEGMCCGTLRQVKKYTFDGVDFKEI